MRARNGSVSGPTLNPPMLYTRLLPTLRLPCTYPRLHYRPAYPAPHQSPGREPFLCPGEHRIPRPSSTSRQFSSSDTSTPTPRLLTTFLLLPTLRLAVGPRPAGFLPLIRPPTMFESDARQTGLAGHFSFSAKFNSMAKQKNRLTATRPQNRFARTGKYWPGEKPAYPVPTLHL